MMEFEMHCHCGALVECGRLKAVIEDSASKLLIERDANRLLRGVNSALKKRVEGLEYSNAKRAQKITQLRETASRVKDFSLQLAQVESDIQKTLAVIEQDAEHALKMLKDLSHTIQKQCAFDSHPSKISLPFIGSCIDEASRVIARICCHFPVSSSPKAFEGQNRQQTRAAVNLEAGAADTKRKKSVRQSPEPGLQQTERARSAQQSQLYVQALETRLSFLESEIAQLRRQTCLAFTGDVHQQLPSSPFLLRVEKSKCSKVETKPLQGAS
jgi:hypothetical protein